jgi:DNA integrity scanning protein DisA with diadenylate cyclase activity
MKTTVSLYDFRREFAQCRPDNFSYEGLSILFDYLEELGDSCGEEFELDVIGLCCEWNEDTPENIAADYSIDIEDDGNALANVLDHLNDETMVAGVTDAGTIVYLAY